MAKREFLQLAHTYKPGKHGIGGWFISEKLDGMRCFWDGGVTRGMWASEVPWANTAKDSRLVEQPRATGLWTRYGHVIHAPSWFLDQLPKCCLDGELYAGRGNFQQLISTVKKMIPDHAAWRNVRYVVFDAPPPETVFADGKINNTNFKKTFTGVWDWWYPKAAGAGISLVARSLGAMSPFQSRIGFLKGMGVKVPVGADVCYLHEQTQLPFYTEAAEQYVEDALDEIIDRGGEGLILKSPACLWLPERCHGMIKYKAVNDAEGTVVGYVWGRETDKGSKLLGLMGALVIKQDNGRRLELSGFTDEERAMYYLHRLPEDPTFRMGAQEHGCHFPGEQVTNQIDNPTFPRGSRVTYRYRELSDDGVAKEARYWRKPA